MRLIQAPRSGSALWPEWRLDVNRRQAWTRPCTRRIVPAEDIIKATSLNDALGEHAPWCRTAPNAPPIHTKPPVGDACESAGARQPWRMLTARAATISNVTAAMNDSTPITSFARWVSGIASVGLNAIEFVAAM